MLSVSGPEQVHSYGSNGTAAGLSGSRDSNPYDLLSVGVCWWRSGERQGEGFGPSQAPDGR
ncbi:hypothetical protein AGR4B_pAt20476 [Agrobacterium tumefaciens str. CFBP 5621]|nr:hypothetical protein AGR4B_pAt20476 [Agrobacterium tumefaciens str. CFBP 5621]